MRTTETQFWSSDPVVRNLVKDTHGFLRSKKPVDFTAAVGSVADNVLRAWVVAVYEIVLVCRE